MSSQALKPIDWDLRGEMVVHDFYDGPLCYHVEVDGVMFLVFNSMLVTYLGEDHCELYVEHSPEEGWEYPDDWHDIRGLIEFQFKNGYRAFWFSPQGDILIEGALEVANYLRPSWFRSEDVEDD